MIVGFIAGCSVGVIVGMVLASMFAAGNAEDKKNQGPQ
jgi:hypothetical protein